MIWLAISLYVLGAFNEYRTQSGPYGAGSNNFERILLALLWPGLVILCLVLQLIFWLFEKD